jgi:hypothetical protein
MHPPSNPKLTREQYDELNDQFSSTPNPDDGFTETGEHWKLIAILNKLGYSPFSRGDAIVLAQRLPDEGYEERGDHDAIVE